MDTQTQTTQTAKRKSGASKKKGAASIGSHVTGLKDQKPALVTVGQKMDAKVSGLDKKIVTEAQKIVHGFRAENDKLATIKAQAEKQRGGLSDIVFRIVLLGWDKVDNKAHAWVFCRALLDSAELAERTEAKRVQKLDDVPSARTVLGASWQTYKSQILKCLAIGLDPTQFKTGTDYRAAASKIRPTTRAPRTTAGRKAAAETAAEALEGTGSNLRTELQAAITEFITACAAASEAEQLKHANNLHKLTVKVAEQNRKQQAPAEAPQADAATGTM